MNYLFNTNSSSGNLSCDEYFSPLKLSEITATLKQQDFFAVHFNIRSFSKIEDKINYFLIGMKRIPDVVAISETKLNLSSISNINIALLIINFYPMIPLLAVGLYIKKTLKFRLRDYLILCLQDCEDLWREIESKESNFILAVIYCHPKQKLLLFNDKLCENLLT